MVGQDASAEHPKLPKLGGSKEASVEHPRLSKPIQTFPVRNGLWMFTCMVLLPIRKKKKKALYFLLLICIRQ